MKIFKPVSFHNILRQSTGNEINIPGNIVEETDVIFVLGVSIILYLLSALCCIHSTPLIFSKYF